MRKLFSILLVGILWIGMTLPATAVTNTHLVPCQESAAFNERLQNAPQTYYFEAPYQSYATNLLCGEDGLPHLQLRFDRAVDVAIPFAIFFYIAGFIGWSGRAYLLGSKRMSKPEEAEIFIDIALAMQAFAQGLLWPLIAFKELMSGELTAPASEVSVSPR
ncbi:MAG: Photosystem I reaction center subunit III [Phormidesmis sp. RL_2_1]|nr:Photosystem I reaction center subunit III [Phormidesmis sp. RL_2_1]